MQFYGFQNDFALPFRFRANMKIYKVSNYSAKILCGCFKQILRKEQIQFTFINK